MPVLEQKTGPLYPETLAIMRRHNLNVASAFQCGKMTMAQMIPNPLIADPARQHEKPAHAPTSIPGGAIVAPIHSGRVSQGTMNAAVPWYQSLFVDREEGDRDQDDEDD
ncbi:hypothetical protein N7489_003909 [Penicillium chrysogenum]|uniref:uncharacterized protein n=1 Tax=Penicillium chrysogenum TaxID=5076 RepID=UPI0024DF0E01|nr:uncharacterized protein N7489_003909 [Penicillium chrysogenum]KAJ5243813.1 hypothetical protein N7489_003909 [Penicillium chrysogenum]